MTVAGIVAAAAVVAGGGFLALRAVTRILTEEHR